ncbi:cell wall-active antibiotics response protein [Micromonospora rifamycinica]|uniref:Adhesin domain-containing protein n=1 Tax=Micromonospora rifamycinica TaxID=291594 RepID=A0A1C5GRY1_9ACTN|nr:cell wall-active antibiotics response protein [Micromonospora rifamycinica]SCG36545.1 hypothetical protein GA0070623_0216 [Micromonospora rifamycinica]
MAEPDQGYRPTAGGQRPVFEPVIEVTGDPVDVEVTGDPASDRPPRSPWPRGARWLAAAAALVVALGAIAVVVTMANPDRLGVVFSGGSDAPPVTVGGGPGGAGAAETAAGRAATAPVGGLRRATFELMDGVTSFRLRVDDLGADLYRISSPADAGLTPRPEVSGDRVQLRVTRRDEPGRGVVDVVLNSRLTWRLRLIGGVSDHVLDLSAARLSGVELIGGAARIDLRLPPTKGTRTVRMTGGVNQFVVRAPDGPPVRIRASAGAGSVVWYGDRRDGLARGATVGSADWDRSPDRLYLDLVAGANAVTVVED